MMNRKMPKPDWGVVNLDDESFAIHSVGSASARQGYRLYGKPRNPPGTCGDIALLLRIDSPTSDVMIRFFEMMHDY